MWNDTLVSNTIDFVNFLTIYCHARPSMLYIVSPTPFHHPNIGGGAGKQ